MKNNYNVGIFYRFKHGKRFFRRAKSSIKGNLFFFNLEEKIINKKR